MITTLRHFVRKIIADFDILVNLLSKVILMCQKNVVTSDPHCNIRPLIRATLYHCSVKQCREMSCLHVDVSCFLASRGSDTFPREARKSEEIGDICTQARRCQACSNKKCFSITT